MFVVVVVVVGWEVGDAIVAGCPAGLDEMLAASWRRVRRYAAMWTLGEYI